MTIFKIVEARRYMCGRIARQLRGEHHAATMRVGVDAHRGLRTIYDQSFYRKAWIINGELAALGGATGTMMAPSAFVWLAMSEKATRYPIEVVKEARRQIAAIMALGKLELRTTIIDGDEAAKRLVVFLGWHVTDDGEGAPAETRYGRKRLIDFIDREPSIRMSFGGGAAIAMGYHEIEETRSA